MSSLLFISTNKEMNLCPYYGSVSRSTVCEVGEENRLDGECSSSCSVRIAPRAQIPSIESVAVAPMLIKHLS